MDKTIHAEGSKIFWPIMVHGFPFPPYAIQVQFVEALMDTIDRRQVGIFESPTGTVS